MRPLVSPEREGVASGRATWIRSTALNTVQDRIVSVAQAAVAPFADECFYLAIGNSLGLHRLYPHITGGAAGVQQPNYAFRA